MAGYTLYGSEVSYFTGKARAYLRWRSVDFSEEQATQDVYRNIIMPNVGWPVIPVMKAPDGEIIQDTADIIAHVEAAEARTPPVRPETPLQRFVCELLHLYADEWLVIPAMHYRWTYNEDWAYGEFGALSAPDLSPDAQYELGKKNGARFKGALPVLGISQATIPGIEKSYEAFLAEFTAHLEQYPFVMGARPTLADFAFIGPLYAHLYRDPASGKLMKRLAPKVADWVERAHEGQRGDGTLPEGDTVPTTLRPILARQMREQLPSLQTINAMFADWVAQASPGERVPRALGDLEIDIEGHRETAKARSFQLWRLQAALDIYAGMDAETRERADALLDETGGEALKTFKLPARLKRENCRVVLA
ncbi:glutathione S-transferase family protein [Henriciella sp.]|uniref:glutathione S-transferase family protein n=1 Tax=Henriciella sp. TaxID=1968823 RepID=UPI0026200687|nr:glutathione S-transferase family protein [Henriciella sp.]